MELAIRSSPLTDSRIQTLCNEIQQLNSQFAELQREHRRIHREHSHKCKQALSISLSHLGKVIADVEKADGKLIYWYEQKKGVKLMLRFVGIDKRTEAIVGRKTKQIKGDVQKAEKKFRNTSQAFTHGLNAVQGLNTKVISYSLLEVGTVHNSTTSTLTDFNTELQEVETATMEKHLEHVQVEKQIEEVHNDISLTESSRNVAANARNTCAGHAAGGFITGAGLFALGFFCPPAWAGVPAAAIYGTVNVISSTTLDAQAKNLQKRSDQLSVQLNDLKDQIKALEDQMPGLEGKKRTLGDSVTAVTVLQDKCADLRQGSQALLDQLSSAQMALSRIRMQLDKIAATLMTCEYKKTRRDLAKQLRRVVSEVRGGEISKHHEGSVVLGIERRLSTLEATTPHVLMILNE